MKSAILAAGMVLLLCTAACAQHGVTAKGLKIGFGFADISTEYSELNDLVDSRVGFNGGAFLTYSINRRFAVQPELLYVSKGAGKSALFFSVTWSIDYLEVPVLAKFDLKPNGPLHPNLLAGPALGILLSSKFHIFGDSYDVADGLKSTDLGFVFGGELDYRHITLDVRYTLGLVNTIDAAKINKLTGAQPNDLYYLEGDPTSKNTNLAFMLGYRF